jgi:hypothetical protein
MEKDIFIYYNNVIYKVLMKKINILLEKLFNMKINLSINFGVKNFK